MSTATASIVETIPGTRTDIDILGKCRQMFCRPQELRRSWCVEDGTRRAWWVWGWIHWARADGTRKTMDGEKDVLMRKMTR